MLGCISSPRCFFCSCRWCVHADDDEEETTGHTSLPLKVYCDASSDFLVEPLSFTLYYVDPDLAGKTVCENITQLFSWHWPGDDESILPIVTSIVDTTDLSIVNAVIASQPDCSLKIRQLWGCQGEPNGNSGPHACTVTLILDHNTAAGWVKGVMIYNHPTLVWVVYHGQQAVGTSVT